MKKKRICLHILFIATLLVFSACSLSTLSVNLLSTESFESAANASIIYLHVKVTPSFENTSISWKSFKISTDDNTDCYQDEYTILRSFKNPWESFETVETILIPSYRTEGGRVSFTDTNIQQGSPAVWYRVYFSYAKKSGDKFVTTVVLSESVGN